MLGALPLLQGLCSALQTPHVAEPRGGTAHAIGTRTKTVVTRKSGQNRSPEPTFVEYAAGSGDAEAKATAEGLTDGMWSNYQDEARVAVPETRANRVDDPVYVPNGWTGAMPNGDTVDNDSTFLSTRSFCEDDPNRPKVQACPDGGTAPVFTYHRFWARTGGRCPAGPRASGPGEA
ncbi:glycoside hydrolase family 48 protein [Streptomyces sp. NPDC048565]|uniref:glycoside hydrolase family 48 protein n=1 Tax=Streptomyces sp. NPDC048565 TaxID=3155266 RepID=UPI00342C0959